MHPLRLVLVVIVGLAGCADSKKGLNRQTKAILSGATKVEVYRIDGMEEYANPEQKPKQLGDLTFDGYPVTGTGKDQGKEFAAKLYAVLSDDRSWSNAWAFCFTPGVAFRAWDGKEAVDVVICFRCKNIYCGPSTDNKPHENISFVDSPMQAKLVQLVKEAFPDDKEIQALKEK